MLLGKRPRPPMRRTTSLTEFSVDVGLVLEGAPPAAVHQGQDPAAAAVQHHSWSTGTGTGPVPMEGVAMPPGVDQHHPHPRPHPHDSGGSRHPQQPYHQPDLPFPLIHHQNQLMDVRYYGTATAAAMVSPRRPRRNSGDFQVEIAHFLKACGLCNRRLKPGKDIYMYRGEIAFCSSECRQQQMTLDERKEKKCSLASITKDTPHASAVPAASTAASSEPAAAANGETIAAA